MRRLLILIPLAASVAAAAPPGRNWRFSTEVRRGDSPPRHYPLAVGNSWVYRNALRELEPGSQAGEVRWESIIRITDQAQVPEGRMVLRSITIGPAQKIPPTSALAPKPVTTTPHYLLRGHSVYEVPQSDWDARHRRLSAWYRKQLPDAVPEFCFPLAPGLRWAEPSREAADRRQERLFYAGKAAAPNPGMYYWMVEVQKGKDSHLVYRALSGPIQRWFRDGVGVTKETFIHSGSLWEETAELVRFRPAPDRR